MGSKSRALVPQLTVCVVLNEALRLARRGEFTSVAVVGVNPGGDVFEAYATGLDAGPLIDAIQSIADDLTETAPVNDIDDVGPESGPRAA